MRAVGARTARLWPRFEIRVAGALEAAVRTRARAASCGMGHSTANVPRVPRSQGAPEVVELNQPLTARLAAVQVSARVRAHAPRAARGSRNAPRRGGRMHAARDPGGHA